MSFSLRKHCSFLFIFLLIFNICLYAGPGGPDEKNEQKKEKRSINLKEHFNDHIRDLFNTCDLLNKISYSVFEKAVIGYYNMKNEGKLKGNLLSILDFRQASNEERYYLIDMGNKALIMRSLVAHGKNSGKKYPVSFSNVPQSNKTSMGFYVTAETYKGENGLSLKLDGVDFPFNTNVRMRNIVIHGSDYVSPQEIEENGFIGQSEGCPALPLNNYKEIINMIKGGNCLFIYTSDPLYQNYSSYLNLNSALSYYISML